MILLSDIQVKADSLLASLPEFISQYSDYAAQIAAIDPASPTAQADLDNIDVQKGIYYDTNWPAIKQVYEEYNILCNEFAQQGSTEEELEQLKELRSPVSSVLSTAGNTSKAYSFAKTTKQSEITTSGPAPEPTVPPIEPVPTVPPTPGTTTETEAAAVVASGTKVSKSQIVQGAPLARPPSGKGATSNSSATNNLNAFISNIKRYGVPLSSKFEVELPVIGNVNETRPINILCNSASMPEQRIRVTEQKIFGENNFLAGGADFGQLQLTFLVTSQFDVHDYFEQWMNMIYSKGYKTLGFYNQYTKEIAVHNLDKSGQRIFSAYYQECFPINIATTGVSYDNNHPMTLNVSFAYRTWYSYTTSNSLIDPELNPLKLNSPSALRAFDNSTLGDPTSPFGGNGVAAATALGPIMGSSALDAANQAANGVKSLSNLADGTQVGSLMGKYMNQLGTASSMIGAGIGDIGSNLNTILAPMQAIAGGVTSMSGVLSSVDNLLGRMGIKTNIGGVVSNLNGVAGVVSVVGQLNGIPGALSSLGAVTGSVGGELANIQRSLANVPGATTGMMNSIGNMSKVFGNNANTTSSIAGMNFSNPPTGLNNNINPNNSQVSYTG